MVYFVLLNVKLLLMTWEIVFEPATFDISFYIIQVAELESTMGVFH